MTKVLTSSFGAFRNRPGWQPAVISLLTPDWHDQSKTWPVVESLQPRWSYFKSEDFDDQYIRQLRTLGMDEILQEMIDVAGDADYLVLCCHESDPAECHRGLLSDWLRKRGLTISEAPKRVAPPKGPFRERDDKGRQIVQVGSGRKYSYAWPGSRKLRVGEFVILPGNHWNPEPRKAEVTSLGSDYAGDLVEIIRRARKTEVPRK